MAAKNELTFVPSLQLFAQSRLEAPLTVLSGSNNSGKSLTLKWLKSALGRQAYMVGTNRFYHVYHFSSGIRDPSQLDNLENQFQSHFNQENYNHEQNSFDLNQIIIGLSDKKRLELFELCGKLIGNKFEMKKVESENDLSPRYIDMDGQNLSVGSTGTRLLMTILGICMDDRFNTILIDEPELGLSPRVQQVLATFFDDQEARKKIFPHLSRIYLATHSHLMLSRRDISSNFVVSKDESKISIQRIKGINDFHRLQFNLLGNSLESMYFPSSIVVVEGKTDHMYLDRVLQMKFPDRRVAVIPANGDVKKKIHSLKETLGDLEKSPLRSRIFVVLDSVHQPGLSDELTKMGVFEENIVTWDKNGIEYLYPPKILASVYCCATDDLVGLSIIGDKITLNGITKTKNELATHIVAAMNDNCEYPSELVKKLISPVSAAIM